ncbi:hypothetical protein Cgig2_022106 [Carnegiea gigantea]|uniref:Cytochrome P450 n=1 Tax=Carnegiea gigantea TaxID=171969 RepID=A0A9Q1K1A5_9CARY|nr:hypothetical protein Cgig2_022106 [Carnegiea gigantea]
MEAPTWAAYAVAWLPPPPPQTEPTTRPKTGPIIGNFNLLGSHPHRSLHELSKKYGPVMMVRLGSVPALVGSSVEMAKLCLKTHDLVFADRPKTAAGKYVTYNYSNITWSQYGPYWRQARRIFLMELFSAKRLESYEYIRVEELNSFPRGMYEHSLTCKAIPLKDHLSTLSMNVISRMALGKRYLDEGESSIMMPDEFQKMIDEVFLLNGVFNLGDWIPCLKYFDVQGYVTRMKSLAKKLDRFLDHVLDEHNSRREKEKQNWVAKDMVDVLLELAGDPTLEVKLETIGVKALIEDLIAGGTESSTVTLEWAMSELLKQPRIIAKAVEELDSVIGKERWVQEKDIQNLTYIRAIVKETMRLHPVVPMLVPRLAREDVQVKGYDIPKGTIVLVNTFSSQRDPNVYERPEEFWPERFIGMNIDVKGQDFELLPFGSGRRMCPGYSLGLKVIESGLANLLHGFTWKLPNNMRPEDLNMEEIFGLSNPKKIPLTAFIEPRLDYHLFKP